MSPHAIIFGFCFFAMLATFLAAMFRTVADTDKRKIKPPAPSDFFKCLSCGVYEDDNGRQQTNAPGPSDRYRVRECTDCRGKAITARRQRNFSAETITGSNERKGSEMPAERNGDCLIRLTDASHACAGNFNNKAAR
jgi:hypothetical protein